MALHRERDLKEAAVTFEQAVDHSPRFAPGHYMLGETRHQLGDLAGAAAAYRQALEINPKDFACWLKLAECCLHLGCLGETRQALDEALALQPDNPDVLALERRFKERCDRGE